MNGVRCLIIGAAAATMLLTAVAVSADAPPWASIAGANDLSASQKELAVRAFSEVKGYLGCADVLTKCLARRPPPAATKRLAAFIVRRIKANRDLDGVRADVEARRRSVLPATVHRIDTDQSPPSGNVAAPVTVVIFADFECPACGQAAPALRRLSREHPEKVVVYFKNFPVKSHPRGVPAAAALLAAGRQGKFWEYHDLLFSPRPDLSDAGLDALAQSLSLDLVRFRADRADPAVIERIRAEKMQGVTLGLVGTPGVFVNGKQYLGLKTYEELADRIEEERELLAETTPPAR